MAASKKQYQGKIAVFVPIFDGRKGKRQNHVRAARARRQIPAGTNVRGTREFKDEFKRQLSEFRQEHAAKIAAKKEAAKAAQAAAQQSAAEETAPL